MLNLDDIDLAIRADRIEHFVRREGPRVGDFVILENGKGCRITYDWGRFVQTTPRRSQSVAFFHLDATGLMIYSGGLDPVIPKTEPKRSDETLAGLAWIYHHNKPGAHNSVTLLVPCRVYLHQPRKGRKP
jgi:hypothetical protein